MTNQEQQEGYDITSILMKCADLKKKGNQYFQDKKFEDALKEYHRIIMYLQSYQQNDEKSIKLIKGQEKELNDLLIIIYQNMSQCHLSQQNYHKARDYADDAIKIRPTEKALYKKALSQIQIGELDEASQAIQQLNDMNFNTKDLQNVLKQKQNIQDKEAKKMYQKMF